MKLLIASDLHGDLAAAEAVFARYAAEGADRLLWLGDLLYHGPRNDLPADYAPKGVIALLNAHRQDLFCVRGNCEAEVDQMVLDFPVLADYALIPVGSRTVFATHGHHHNTATPPPLRDGDVLLHGHTHLYAAEHFDLPGGGRALYLNPGSVALPKGGNPPSYMTLDTESGDWRLCDMQGKGIAEGTLAH
ncbi:MAG: phosphodiesterase [Clostridia bacterium]|nr:phosphodiesterase [Clostridia bacterium]